MDKVSTPSCVDSETSAAAAAAQLTFVGLDPDQLFAPVQSVSVAEYCRSFCERVVKGTYGETLEDNRRLAGEQFVCKPQAYMQLPDSLKRHGMPLSYTLCGSEINPYSAAISLRAIAGVFESPTQALKTHTLCTTDLYCSASCSTGDQDTGRRQQGRHQGAPASAKGRDWQGLLCGVGASLTYLEQSA